MLHSHSFPLAITALVAVSTTIFAEDELTIDQVPVPVATTLRTQANGGTLDEIEAKQKEGKTVYEADIQKPTGKITVMVAADGKILRTESQLDVSAMPAAVQTAVAKAFGEKMPKRGEVETVGSETSFAVEGKIGADDIEIHFSSDGIERSRETQKDDDHEDGKHEHGGSAKEDHQHGQHDESGKPH